MKCLRCQHENLPDARFCEACAALLGRTCANCGAPLRDTARFCPACAHPVAASSGAPRRFCSPESYIPKHLAERILTSKSAVQGERKQVTVLFADLKGSMELLADRDPEQARKLLDPVLEKMMEAVHRYEGTVNQVMGDGIMALFGAPLAVEDHAVRACYAALAMQAAVRAHSDQLRRSQGIEVQIRVGLNSGEVVVRAIGSDLRMDYTAVGQTTHLAARMEQLASPGTTRLTGKTLDMAEGFVNVIVLGPVPVKGLDVPVEVFELTGAGAARTRLQAAVARGLSKFVGRSRELEEMFFALERGGAGKGQVVALTGEPGVGKSRLVWEFTRSHRTRDWLVLESASVSYSKASAYRPVIDLLKNYFQIEDRDDRRRIREKVTGKLLTLDRALEADLLPLLALLDVADDQSWEALDPLQKRLRILDACKRLLLRESHLQPLIVVFEDLHWIDTETQALLDTLVESLPTARLVLLVNFRPEYHPQWTTKTYYTQLRVDPLSTESAQALLDALLGEHASLLALKRLLIERTEGNALYLEEIVRALVETHILEGSRGAYRQTAAVTEVEVPATVQAILAARIDRLSPENKRLLQIAAVIGKDVACTLLAAIAESSECELRQALAELQAAEFVYEANLFPELQYTFKHALTHDVTYATLLQEQRKALHSKIVDAIEQLYSERVAEWMERLGQHALRAERWDKAAIYLREAGLRAAGRSAHREAVSHLEQAIDALEQLPEDKQTLRALVDLRISLRSSLFPLGEHKRLTKHLEDAARLADKLGDRLRYGTVVAFQAHRHWSSGEPLQAASLAEHALTIGNAEQDPRLSLLASHFLGQACHQHGDYVRGVKVISAAIPKLVGDLEQEHCGLALPVSIVVRTWLAFCHAGLGEFEAGIARATQAMALAEQFGFQPYSEFHARFARGVPHALRGDFDLAIDVLEPALKIAREAGLAVMAGSAEIYLGYAYLLRGDIARAVESLEQTVHKGDQVATLAFHLYARAVLAEAYLASGRIEEARGLGEGALQLCRNHNQRGYEAEALHSLGTIYAASAPAEAGRARSYYEHALANATELQMKALMARCRLSLAEVCWKRDERELARKHLNSAVAMFREMNMQFWLRKAEALQGRERPDRTR